MNNKLLERTLKNLVEDIECLGDENDCDGMEVLQYDLERALEILEKIRIKNIRCRNDRIEI